MANNNEERKNKSTFNTDNRGSVRFSHRGKPQQQIYRPGSGPLKKTHDVEDNKDIVIGHIRDMEDRSSKSINYNKKIRPKDENICSENLALSDADTNKSKKPGQALYRAKHKNINTDAINKCHIENKKNIQGDNALCRVDNNNSAKFSDKKSKNKRYSHRHHSNSSTSYNPIPRDIRHSSEPRSLPHTDKCHEVKSFECLEKSYNDKIKTKQHSGKNNSSNFNTIDSKCRDKTRALLNLPPRLQKKFLLDNGYPLDSLSPEKLNFYANKKNSPNINVDVKPPIDSINNLNINNRINMNEKSSTWCQTLPLVRGRGRGIRKSNKPPLCTDSFKIDKRVPHIEHNTYTSSTPHSNSPFVSWDGKTYDKNDFCKLSQSEDTGSINSIDSEVYYNIAYNNETMQHNFNSTDNVDTINELANMHISPHIKKMDWSEEVEMQEQQEKGRISPKRGTHHRPTRERRRSWSRSRSITNRSSSGGSERTLVSRDQVNIAKPDYSKFNAESDTTIDIDCIRGYSESINMDRFRNNEDYYMNRDTNNKIHYNSAEQKYKKTTPLAPGLLILPQKSNVAPQNNSISSSTCQRMLYDPNNPNKPIMVTTHANDNRTADCSNTEYNKHTYDLNSLALGPELVHVRPPWYDIKNQSTRHIHIVNCVEKLDLQLYWILKNGALLNDWKKVQQLRSNLQKCLLSLLVSDIKFCQTENVEHHFWKIVFYNLIELLRKAIAVDAQKKDIYQEKLLSVIDEATKFYEGLLGDLEEAYKFKLEDILGSNMLLPPKGLGLIGLALVSTQKIFLFLGDLARYREQVFDTGNYSRSKQYYMKAQQVNPKNGRPYNQLAILSIYARRKFDAVYYYMRSLMSSNPFHSARDSLLSLFDENRKKYETLDKKRKEELDKRQQANKDPDDDEERVRKEIWIHPGRKSENEKTDEEKLLEGNEDLVDMSSIDLNKRFITSYLHVHGKLITKIGMESFVNVCRQMLLEFRTLLTRSPLPVNSHRLLQLVALNIFAIDSTTSETTPDRRGEVQERALGIAIEMASLLLDRCVTLISAQVGSPRLFVPPDVQVMLPALKVFCDWLLCHINIWNPPPFSKDLRIGSSTDLWTKLADLIGLLEQLDHKQALLTSEPKEGHSVVRLQEDVTLCGFMPLMYAAPENVYAPDTIDPEAAQVALRLHKIQFFGSEYLCGVDPPVLKPVSRGKKGFKYVSMLLDLEAKEIEPVNTVIFDEPEEKKPPKKEVDFESDPSIKNETKLLLIRRRELEREKMLEEEREKRFQDILNGYGILELEIKPRFLVPDTNCFIDYLQDLQNIAACRYFTLMVPLVVLNELEGLSRGSVNSREEVAGKASQALKVLRQKKSCIKFLTTRGNVLNNPSFTAEEITKSYDIQNNDDRILASALSLCKRDVKTETEASGSKPKVTRIKREVVLLTMDRNLRVKALASDLPVRELPDFVKWAEL